MSRVAAIGEALRIQGFGLAGAMTLDAPTPDAVREAWSTLPTDVDVVILTPAAALALGEEAHANPRRLPVVLPQ